jgi:hypothetical protein
VPFSGTLSGRLPTLRYADGVVTLGGALEAEIFGGHVSLDGLRIEQPLGVLPSMSADVRMRDIDLERLTSTFSFGHMTGKLHADILGIELLGLAGSALRRPHLDARGRRQPASHQPACREEHRVDRRRRDPRSCPRASSDCSTSSTTTASICAARCATRSARWTESR